MPHVELSLAEQDAQDEALIQQTFEPGFNIDFANDLGTGEKDKDAVDYEDQADDDLADDDEGIGGTSSGEPSDPLARTDPGRANASTFAVAPTDGEHEDLFGEEAIPTTFDVDHVRLATDASVFNDRFDVANERDLGQRDRVESTENQASKEQQLQQELFARSRATLAADTIPIPPSSTEELLSALWPKFRRHATPRFMDLLPPKKARYMARPIPKPPRAIHPTKVGLDPSQDQERLFKISSDNRKRQWRESETAGVITVGMHDNVESENESEMEMFSDESEEDTCGISLMDMQMLCEDWEPTRHSDSDSSTNSHKLSEASVKDTSSLKNYRAGTFPDYSNSALRSARENQLLEQPLSRSLREPELVTSHLAKRIKVDLNDPYLLVDYAEKPKLETLPHSSSNVKSLGRSSGSKGFNQKYNISNDEAYDLLKENHQNKIRGMLGGLHLEHSMAALRLQWPFYKTRLEKHEARSFHRPPLKVNRQEPISFTKPLFIKRKHAKGKDARTLFAQTNDLSINDNSNILLLEYSEEHPMMLSNLGMGSKVVNHYRKKTPEDGTRPKMDIGELNVLLPQDKSPFSLFGHVDPGHLTSAIHNGMYRAPIFRQAAKGIDFLVIRSFTGIHGSSWFMRNVENLHVAGQELPVVDVPGPHSRKVTTASKNRLKMISYRMARRNKSHRISVSEVTNHFIDTSDMQNRQKMKEFMQFDKDHKEWKMRPGESIPEEEVVRTMVKPEDVCLLESMQVGQQHLQDAGLSKDDDDVSEGDDTKEDENIELQLAPWFISRNFLNASQGKAMLQLHGEGDPSGRGEALSFIKTSMKGGFRAVGESIAERMKDKTMKENGGHTYNVARQQQAYEDSIRRIWDAQKQSLSSNIEQSDSDIEDDDFAAVSDGNTGTSFPRSEGRAQSFSRRRDDETASHSTKWSTNSQMGKILEITRVVRDRYGNEEEVKDISKNPRVIRQYLRRRRALDASQEDITDIRPGEDVEENKRKELRLKKELARLERNKDRRIARDKQKGIFTDGAAEADGSPTSPGATTVKSGATSRKCANCGMVGHIKTNKKLCPVLNGTRKPEEGFSTSAFTSGAPTL